MRQASFRGTLLFLQFGGASRHFFLRHADLLGESFVIRFRGLHAFGQLINFCFAGLLGLAERAHLATNVKEKVERSRDIDNGEDQQNPFACIARSLGLYCGYRFVRFGHRFLRKMFTTGEDIV